MDDCIFHHFNYFKHLIDPVRLEETPCYAACHVMIPPPLYATTWEAGTPQVTRADDKDVAEGLLGPLAFGRHLVLRTRYCSKNAALLCFQSQHPLQTGGSLWHDINPGNPIILHRPVGRVTARPIKLEECRVNLDCWSC